MKLIRWRSTNCRYVWPILFWRTKPRGIAIGWLAHIWEWRVHTQDYAEEIEARANLKYQLNECNILSPDQIERIARRDVWSHRLTITTSELVKLIAVDEAFANFDAHVSMSPEVRKQAEVVRKLLQEPKTISSRPRGPQSKQFERTDLNFGGVD